LFHLFPYERKESFRKSSTNHLEKEQNSRHFPRNMSNGSKITAVFNANAKRIMGEGNRSQIVDELVYLWLQKI
jgi:hypothetical protein